MRFVNREHLGGFIAHDEQNPNGDPATYTPDVWSFLLRAYMVSKVLREGPQSVFNIVDVGCGEGHAVKWFLGHNERMLTKRKDGGRQLPGRVVAVGVDGCQEAKDRCVIPPELFTVHDFTKGPIGGPLDDIDLIWSCEFVEHVEEKYLGNILDLFKRAKIVAMTHAFPGQPGHHHVNCQRPEYWHAKMEPLNFLLDSVVTYESRKLAPDSHWARSGLVFARKG